MLNISEIHQLKISVTFYALIYIIKLLLEKTLEKEIGEPQPG